MADVTVRLWAPGATTANIWILPDHDYGRPTAPLGSEQLEQASVHAMMRVDDEHFTYELAVGTNYLLSIDGGEPRPDPRSPRQPFGVHGPSQAWSATGYSPIDPACSSGEILGGVWYELHVGTFTSAGTLDSAIDKLPHLADLGVDVVELMPIVPFPGDRGWGYDGVSLYAVHEAYGGPDALLRFVDAAHSHQIAVCLDVVYNHFGPAGNYAPVFAPYFTTKHTTPWGDAINLDDHHSDGVRAFIIDNAIRWFTEFGVDALRLDAVHALIDDSPTHILAELSARVDECEAALGRRLTLVAESDLNQARTVRSLADDGLGMDGQWNDDLHHALHSYMTGETFGYYVDFGAPEVLAKAYNDVFVHDGSYSTFREATWGTPPDDDVARHKYLIFNQNHDQVGNRGQGDRPDANLTPGAIAASAALVLLSCYTPMLFQGQEWATRRPFQFFTDHDPILGEQVTRGRLAEFTRHEWDAIYGKNATIPDPQAESTFLHSKLDWSELSDVDHAEMLAWFTRLIQIRKEHQLASESVTTADYTDNGFRITTGAITVMCAPTDKQAFFTESRSRILASWGDVTHDGTNVTLSPFSVLICSD